MTDEKRIALLPGDGIGPEVVCEAKKVLDTLSDFVFEEARVGGSAIDFEGNALPEKTIDVCKRNDAILMGAVGGPKWDDIPMKKRPERAALLPLRKIFGLYANLRPVIFFRSLSKSSPMKKRIFGDATFEVLIIRELTGGIYFGKKSKGYNWSSDELKYSKEEVKRIAKLAFEISMKRKKKVTSVDKANVLDSMVLWRDIIKEVSKDYPEVELNNYYVDNMAMQLVRNPKQFDVIVCGNMFGDILSDELAGICGSLGLLPSACIREDGFGLFEPVHGSAPDIAGKGIANPIAAILSAGMMLEYSFGMENKAKRIQDSVEKVLEEGYKTFDMLCSEEDEVTSTKEMGDLVVEKLENEN